MKNKNLIVKLLWCVNLSFDGLGQTYFPQNRRLTRQMKRELVKSMRTVALLAMFSQDSSVVNNIQGCLKSMCVMEPDLILNPILERAVPSLEALTEVSLCILFYKRYYHMLDSPHNCHHRSIRCNSTSHCFSASSLCWCKASCSYSSAANPRDRPRTFIMIILTSCSPITQNDPSKTVQIFFRLYSFSPFHVRINLVVYHVFSC